MGTRPDAIILSISMNDTYEYIEKTISFLESTVECEVIALCLFPWYRPLTGRDPWVQAILFQKNHSRM